MGDKYIMVRLLRSTRARLETVRQSMLLAADVGLRTFEVDTRDRVSLDQVINALIEQREKHADRRRRSAANRRKRIKPHEPDRGPELGEAIEVSRMGEDPAGTVLVPEPFVGGSEPDQVEGKQLS